MSTNSLRILMESCVTQDDSWSVGSGSNADNTSRCSSPTQPVGAQGPPVKRVKAKRGRKKAPMSPPPKTSYKFR